MATVPAPTRLSGIASLSGIRPPASVSPDGVRTRVLARLPDKLEAIKLRKMPESFARQEVRRAIEQLVDAEGPRLPAAERNALVEELVQDSNGYGPLDELFADAAVREVLVLGPQTVLARRETGWLPTNAKFRDAEHLRRVLRKAVAAADPVGEKLSDAAVDGRLNNGFRVVAVMPPAVLELPATVLFTRFDPTQTPKPASGTVSTSAASRTPSGAIGMAATTRAAPGLVQTPAPGGSGLTSTPEPRSGLTPRPVARPTPTPAPVDPYATLRSRITERITFRLAKLGVYDLSRLDPKEVQRVIGAYVAEAAAEEAVQLAEADAARLTLEVIAALRPSGN